MPEPGEPTNDEVADGEAVPRDESVAESDEVLVLEDLLVEEVSIDGMCGVY